MKLSGSIEGSGVPCGVIRDDVQNETSTTGACHKRDPEQDHRFATAYLQFREGALECNRMLLVGSVRT